MFEIIAIVLLVLTIGSIALFSVWADNPVGLLICFLVFGLVGAMGLDVAQDTKNSLNLKTLLDANYLSYDEKTGEYSVNSVETIVGSERYQNYLKVQELKNQITELENK